MKEDEKEKEKEETKGKEAEGYLMAKLAEAMTGINQSIALLTKRLDQIDAEPAVVPSVAPGIDPGFSEKGIKKEFEPLKDIHFKDIDKPNKYDGIHLQIWSQNFMNFLERRDRRWSKLLREIQAKSVHPLNSENKAEISTNLGLDDSLQEAFAHQL